MAATSNNATVAKRRWRGCDSSRAKSSTSGKGGGGSAGREARSRDRESMDRLKASSAWSVLDRSPDPVSARSKRLSPIVWVDDGRALSRGVVINLGQFM